MNVRAANYSGFTIIELIAVILLISIISVFAALRLSGISSWKHESTLRKFANTLELIIDDASARSETYQLVINFQENSYRALRVIPEDETVIKQVDYLENLRLESEKARRKQEKLEKEETIEVQFEKEDIRQSGELDKLYFSTLFQDPHKETQLGIPLTFPNLYKETFLGNDLKFRDVFIDGEIYNDGEIPIIVTPQGINSTLAIRILIENNVFVVQLSPGDSHVETITGEGKDFIELYEQQNKTK